MKLARIWLLLLLAVLLPIRGAVAGAMLCPVDGGVPSEVHVGQHAGPHDMAHHDAGHDVHAHDGDAGHHEGHDQEACNLCAAFCSLTPLLGGAAAWPEPEALPAVRFPDVSTPAPRFHSGGQERPPRSL